MIFVNPTACILVLSLINIGTASLHRSLDDIKRQNISYGNVSLSCHKFTTLFYKTLSDGNDKNIVTSPVNLYMAMSQLSYAAENTTLDELRTILYHNDTDLLRDEFRDLTFLLNNIKGVELYTASVLYMQENYSHELEFSQICVNIFKSPLKSVNFKDIVLTVDGINSWVREVTNNKISNVISTDNVDKDETRMVLVNAIYFNGKWLKKFNKNYTHLNNFHISKTETSVVPTMFTFTKFNYGRISKWKANFIEIPYANPDFVMVILLPDEDVELQTVENLFNWKTLVNAPRSFEKVELHLPKFKVEALIDVKNVLENKIGINTMFSKSRANFKRLTSHSVHISYMIQKVFIEVNEEGSKAAAATTTVGAEIRALKFPKRFMVDRPFLFAIEYKPGMIPLLLGSVRKVDFTPQKVE